MTGSQALDYLNYELAHAVADKDKFESELEKVSDLLSLRNQDVLNLQRDVELSDLEFREMSWKYAESDWLARDWKKYAEARENELSDELSDAKALERMWYNTASAASEKVRDLEKKLNDESAKHFKELVERQLRAPVAVARPAIAATEAPRRQLDLDSEAQRVRRSARLARKHEPY